jgi:hypothetical protein
MASSTSSMGAKLGLAETEDKVGSCGPLSRALEKLRKVSLTNSKELKRGGSLPGKAA